MTSIDPVTDEQPMKFVAELKDETLRAVEEEDLIIIETIEPDDPIRQRKFRVLFADMAGAQEWEETPAVYTVAFSEDDAFATIRFLVMNEVPEEDLVEDGDTYTETWYEFYTKEVVVNNGWYKVNNDR